MDHPTSPGPRRSHPSRLGRSVSRTTRLVLIGGMAAGAGFAGVSGIASASTTSSSSSTPSSMSRSTSSSAPGATGSGSAPAPGQPGPGHGRKGGPDGPGGGGGPGPGHGRKGGPGGPGGGGTITAISGSTLTLRTMNGTETVDTTSSTTYTKELRSISLSDLHVGEVVHVAGPRPGSGSSSSPSATPVAPGTGTVDASRVTVVEPSLAGRVLSVSNGTYAIVGRDGQLLTVTTTGSTRFDRQAGPPRSSTTSTTSSVSASTISAGSHIMAVGTRDSLTHLSANLVLLAPTPPAPGQTRAAPPSAGSSSAGSSSSTTEAPAVGS